MIPKTLLAVDGSARTLIWVDVVPSTGATVGCGGGGRGVSVTLGLKVTGSVEVTSKAPAVGASCLFDPGAQLLKSKIKRMWKINFDFTGRRVQRKCSKD